MLTNPVARTRRLYRAVTTAAGLLDSSFLGRGRPLGPARVLNAIGRGTSDLADLRSYLRLDPGLLSRLLRGLEEEGLVTLEPSGSDGRRRQASLTGKGRTEFAAYETLADAQAADLLARHPRPDALLAAMDVVATALAFDRTAIEPVPPTDGRALACLAAYYDELAQRFPGGFDVTLSADPQTEDMQPPRGDFLIAVSDGMPIGCVALKGTDKAYAEIKRLWTAPAARGMGLAHRLMDEIEVRAKALGIATLRLDSNRALHEAVAFYRKRGWSEIDRYNDDPYPDLFFEKHLQS